jgi:hypothetical protein
MARYHRVTQRGPTIAVNYWHPMRFDCKYVYWRFVRDVASCQRAIGGDDGREKQAEEQG